MTTIPFTFCTVCGDLIRFDTAGPPRTGLRGRRSPGHNPAACSGWDHVHGEHDHPASAFPTVVSRRGNLYAVTQLVEAPA